MSQVLGVRNHSCVGSTTFSQPRAHNIGTRVWHQGFAPPQRLDPASFTNTMPHPFVSDGMILRMGPMSTAP